jgi:transposase
MAYINGENREQITFIPKSLDEWIEDDNEVRIIDAYVDMINLDTIGFKVYSGNRPGQKPYHREDLLKIALYCYMNKIRSSRQIEKECKRNIELMWLTGNLSPDHGTISGFIMTNKKAVKKLFKSFIMMIKELDLVGEKIFAIDGTKIRASNAKNKHYNDNKIKIKIEYYEKKIEEYLEAISSSTSEKEAELKELKITNCREKIEQLKSFKVELISENKKQICLTDLDARSMKNNGKYEPCYNIQTSVDEKYKFVIAYDVVNEVNDQGQLSHMIEATKDIIQGEIEGGKKEKSTFVLDTGYYNISQIIDSSDEYTEILIKPQIRKSGASSVGYDRSNFEYDKENNIYICPEGYILEFKCMSKSRGVNYKRYQCKDCNCCGKMGLCTKSDRGREITRAVEQELLESIEKNTLYKNEIYKSRGSIVEHPFGTIKRHMGYTYFLRRGLESVQAEAGFIFLAYNLRRMINIIGVKELLRIFNDVNALKTKNLPNSCTFFINC